MKTTKLIHKAYLPTSSGYYSVIWEKGDLPCVVYLWVTEFGICWGHDEYDDPESIELGIIKPEEIRFSQKLKENERV